MKALVYTAPYEMVIRDLPVPEPGPDEVLIKVACSGICGSELSGYTGHNALRKPPLVFGHEFAGTIAAIGEGAAADGLTLGMRVTANPLISCGRCVYCLAGKQMLCTGRKLISAALPGSNAEYVAVPAAAVLPLPGNVSFKQGAMAEPLACGIRVAELASLKPSDSLFIAGMGPIGLFVLQAAKGYGVTNIYVSDLNPDRLALAGELGAVPLDPRSQDIPAAVRSRTGGRGADASVDAVGASVTRAQCLAATASGGRLVLTGLHEPETALDLNDVIRREISIAGSFAYTPLQFRQALAWIADGKAGLPEASVIRVPLEEGDFWFSQLLKNPGKTAKVLLDPTVGGA